MLIKNLIQNYFIVLVKKLFLIKMISSTFNPLLYHLMLNNIIWMVLNYTDRY